RARAAEYDLTSYQDVSEADRRIAALTGWLRPGTATAGTHALAIPARLAIMACGWRWGCPWGLSLRVAQPEQQPAGEERGCGPGGEDAEACPGADGQVVQVGGVLDGEPGVHRRVSLDLVLPVRVAGQDGGDDRGEVEQAEDGAGGCRGVPDDGGGAETEQAGQGRAENRAQ